MTQKCVLEAYISESNRYQRNNVRPILGPIPVYDSDYGHQVKAGGEAKKGVHKLNL